MENILSPSNLKVLESISLVDSLLAFDLDGVLVSASAHYSEAIVPLKINELMQKICQLMPVAIISGRSTENLRAMIEFSPRYLFGNYGIEGVLTEEELNKAKIKCRVWKHYLMDFFYVNLFPLGLIMEDKTYSLSIHNGNDKFSSHAEKYLTDMLKLLPAEASVFKADSFVNILPYSVDKNTALIKILANEKKKFSFYIGHDETDETIFRANDPCCLTLRVGKSETTKAKYYLNSQSDICLLLSKFLSFLERSPS